MVLKADNEWRGTSQFVREDISELNYTDVVASHD